MPEGALAWPMAPAQGSGIGREVLGKRAREQGSSHRTGSSDLRVGAPSKDRHPGTGPGYLIHIGSGARPVIVVPRPLCKQGDSGLCVLTSGGTS